MSLVIWTIALSPFYFIIGYLIALATEEVFFNETPNKNLCFGAWACRKLLFPFSSHSDYCWKYRSFCGPSFLVSPFTFLYDKKKTGGARVVIATIWPLKLIPFAVGLILVIVSLLWSSVKRIVGAIAIDSRSTRRLFGFRGDSNIISKLRWFRGSEIVCRKQFLNQRIQSLDDEIKEIRANQEKIVKAIKIADKKKRASSYAHLAQKLDILAKTNRIEREKIAKLIKALDEISLDLEHHEDLLEVTRFLKKCDPEYDDYKKALEASIELLNECRQLIFNSSSSRLKLISNDFDFPPDAIAEEIENAVASDTELVNQWKSVVGEELPASIANVPSKTEKVLN